MQITWALAVLFSLVVATCCLPLLIWRRLRRRAGLTLSLSLIAAAAASVQFGKSASSGTGRPVADLSAQTVPVALAEDRRTGAITEVAPASAADPTKPRKAGVAKICLLDDDVILKPTEAIELPATTVFEDDGPNTGRPDDPETWAYEVKEGFKRRAAIITLAPVKLRPGAKCATAPVKMRIAPLFEETAQAASANHVFAIDGVVDFPIPAERPPVEVGKLIDDISVKAILLEDVNDTVVADRIERSELERAADCLSGARKLAAHVGGGTGRQTNSIVALNNIAAHEASYGCGYGAKQDPSLFLSWDGSAKPPPATLALIGKAGAFLTGAGAAEMTKEAQACVSAALKPGSMEGGEREFRGVKIECQAFARDGGGGAVTIYRRFGAYPEHPDPAPLVAAAAIDAEMPSIAVIAAMPKAFVGKQIAFRGAPCVSDPKAGFLCIVTAGRHTLRIEAGALGISSGAVVGERLIGSCKGLDKLSSAMCRFDIEIEPRSAQDEVTMAELEGERVTRFYSGGIEMRMSKRR